MNAPKPFTVPPVPTSIEKLRHTLNRIPNATGDADHNAYSPPRHRTRVYQNIEPIAEGAYGGTLDIEGDLDFPINPDAEGFLQRYDEEVAANGIDALAWYSSFHFPNKWGIFLPVTSLLYMEVRHFSDLPISRFDKWKIAYDLIVEHEIFHFLADVACARWENVLQAPCWKARRALLNASPASYLEIEEALANAYSLEQNKRNWSPAVRTVVQRFMKRQPPGYRDWRKYVSSENFRLGLRELVKNHIGAHACERQVSLDSEVVDPSVLWPRNDPVLTGQCPITLLRDHQYDWLIPPFTPQFITSIPTVLESEKFSKQVAELEPSLRKRWWRKREELKYRVPRFPDFEKLKGPLSGMFSLRLNDNFRVHLRPQVGYSNWEAVEVGTHKELGHG